MILTVTFNPAVDHTMKVEGELSPEEVKRTQDSRFDAGGNGINVAEYLTALDVEAEATGPVGGFTGDFLKETLTDEAVKTDFVETEGLTRMNETILAGGEEYKINQEGPELGEHVTEKVIQKIGETSPEIVVVSGSLPPGLSSEAVDRIARNHPGKTVVDLHGEVLRELEEKYALCKPNVPELEEAVGHELESREDCIEVAKELEKQQRFQNVVASLGEGGAVLAAPGEAYHARPLPVEVADTVGAGDAMLSGVLWGMTDGVERREWLKRGIAVARKVVSVKGTRMPEFGDVLEDAAKVEIEEV
ncbi:MAG: hexose kinase [Candidatus Nanohaloarchaea archaeon]